MSSPTDPAMKVGTIEGKTTPFGLTLHLLVPLTRTSFLSTIHEEKTIILLVQTLWNDKKGNFASLRVVGTVPTTPFDLNCVIQFATAEQIRNALGLQTSPEQALNLGKLLNSDMAATPNVEKLGRVFITGKSGSGKSYTVGVLIEELLLKKIPVVIIDRHGEYSSLKMLEPPNIPPNITVFNDGEFKGGFISHIVEFGDNTMNPGVDLSIEYLLAAQMSDIVATGQCSIVNLRGLDIPVQENIVNDLLNNLYKASTTRAIPPFFLFIDEAHLFAGKKLKDVVETIRLFAQEGRKFGANLVVITQKPQALDVTIRAQAGTWIIHKLTDVNDVKITINSSEGLSNDSDEEIQMLNAGEAIIVDDIANMAPIRVKVRKRYTMHGGSGYNILEYVKSNQNQSSLVQRLKKQIPTTQLEDIKTRIIHVETTPIDHNVVTNQNDISTQNITPTENIDSAAEIADLQKENDDLQILNQTLELELSGLKVETLTLKDKLEKETKRADESLQIAERVMAQLKKGKK